LVFLAMVGVDAASAQVISRPPDLRIEDVIDSLAGPGGRIQLGDVEYRIGRDPSAKGGVGFLVRIWPDGIVPYVLDNCMTRAQQTLAVQAMRHWMEVAPVRFTPGNGTRDILANHATTPTASLPACGQSRPPSQDGVQYQNYVRIVHSPNANSSCVGMCGGEQTLRFTENANQGVVLHELGHALGMSHEHVRSDRDRFVEVRASNINAQFIHNYRVVQTENCTPYDFGSIMHYGTDYFSLNRAEPTLVPHAQYSNFASRMGQRNALTESDIRDIRVAYGAESCTQPGPTPGPTTAPTLPTRTLDREMTGSTGHQRIVMAATLNVDGLREGWSQGLDLVTGAESPEGQVIVMARAGARAVQHLSFNTPEWPADHVTEYWDDPDHVIRGVFGGESGWSVIMSRAESVYVPSAQRNLENWGWTSQSYRLRQAWDRDVIREQWDSGKDITDIAYGPGGWMYVFSRETHWGAQGWDRATDPTAKIQERWDAGFRITDIAFGEGQWAIIATKNAGIGEQRWTRSETFPEAAIQQAWDDGMHVQALDYGNGQWYVIFSERQ
jgi:astacin